MRARTETGLEGCRGEESQAVLALFTRPLALLLEGPGDVLAFRFQQKEWSPPHRALGWACLLGTMWLHSGPSGHLTAMWGPAHGELSICSCRNRGPGEVKGGPDSSGLLDPRSMEWTSGPGDV